MSDISNYEVYTKRMRVGIYDKCWWIDKIYPEVDTVIDFGCADGSLSEAIKILCPQITKYYGIESNKEFYDTLDKKGIEYCSSFDILPNDIEWDKTIIVMNSVVHEICYYQSIKDFMALLGKFKRTGIRHIAIRDMCWNGEEYDYLDDFFLNDIIKSKYYEQFKDFFRHSDYESSFDLTCQVEFFLKYTYKENWERECSEQYMWYWSDYVKKVIEDNMRIEVDQPFRIIPQIRQIEKDFGIKFPEGLNTHRKMLLTKEK